MCLNSSPFIHKFTSSSSFPFIQIKTQLFKIQIQVYFHSKVQVKGKLDSYFHDHNTTIKIQN